MTTRGIENQYEAHEEILDEIHKLVSAIEDAVNHQDLVTLIAALCIVAVDAAHQLDSEWTTEKRAAILQASMAAAWNDYHAQPDKADLH